MAAAFDAGGVIIFASGVDLVPLSQKHLMTVLPITGYSLYFHFVPSQMLSPGLNAKAQVVVLRPSMPMIRLV